MNIDVLARDIRFGGRVFAKNPGLWILVLLSLALTIGANAGVFGLIDALAFRDLPVSKPAQLFLLGSGEGTIKGLTSQSGPWQLYSYPFYRQLKENDRIFQGLCAFESLPSRIRISIPGGHFEEAATAKLVSSNYFTVLGVTPILGRLLTTEDEKASSQVVVLSYRYWTKLFSRDPGVIGKTIYINGRLFVIVGVTPATFFGERLNPNPEALWVPLTAQPQIMVTDSYLYQPSTAWLNIMGRLTSNRQRPTAEAELTVELRTFLHNQLGLAYADSSQTTQNSYIRLVSGRRGISKLRDRFTQPLQILMLITVLMLLIACVNVSNFLIARSFDRRREIAIRCAVGASRTRLIIQLLTENLLVAIGGGFAGLAVAFWETQALTKLISGDSYIPLRVNFDLRMWAFTFAVSILACLVSGIIPSLKLLGVQFDSRLRETIDERSGYHRPSRFFSSQDILNTAQIALCLLLSVTAILLTESLTRLRADDLGFNDQNLTVVRFDPRLAGYLPSELPTLYREIDERFTEIPGVRSAAVALSEPLDEDVWGSSVAIKSQAATDTDQQDVEYNLVGAHYFETIGIPILKGRGVLSGDTERSVKVAVINDYMARHLLGNQNPIGAYVDLDVPRHEWIQVVGVAADAKYHKLLQKRTAMVYLPVAQCIGYDWYAGSLLLRTYPGEPLSASSIYSVMSGINRDIPVLAVTPASSQVYRLLVNQLMLARLGDVFTALALTLIWIGLYGTMAYSVTQRRKEISIRIALGAQKFDILRLILVRAFLIMTIGIAFGAAGALSISKVLSNRFFGLGSTDASTIALGAAFVLAVTLSAAYVPAHRACFVDPMGSLRE